MATEPHLHAVYLNSVHDCRASAKKNPVPLTIAQTRGACTYDICQIFGILDSLPLALSASNPSSLPSFGQIPPQGKDMYCADSPMTNASACGSHIRGATATAVYRHLQAIDPGVITVQESRSIRAFENSASLCFGKIKLRKPIQGGGKFPSLQNSPD